ncbi:MAG: ATP-binding protein [Vulcanisaeta sp.]|nr:ATP-binding protein [Vulcanisaeta sp.]
MNNIDNIAKKISEELHAIEVRLEGTKIMIHFRDREQEVANLLKAIPNRTGIKAIYGPHGAGKSTLLRLLVDKARSIEELGDYVFIRYGFEERLIREMQLSIPGLGEDVHKQLINALKGLTTEVVTRYAAISLGDVVGNLIDVAKRFIEEHRLRDKTVVLFLDDVDKYVTDYIALYKVANAMADEINWSKIPILAFFTVSDNAAIKALNRLVSKGGYSPYLLWNLPKEDFEKVVNEVIEKTGGKDNIDTELLWQLLGGNIRELGTLINDYDWDVKAWLQTGVINHIENAIKKHAANTFNSTEEALKWLIKKGSIAARDYGLGDFTGQPDAVEGVLGLLEENVMIDINPTGIKHLSKLPNEPWMGRNHAYQIPAYYWALRAMIEKGTTNVKPDDILSIIKT